MKKFNNCSKNSTHSKLLAQSQELPAWMNDLSPEDLENVIEETLDKASRRKRI